MSINDENLRAMITAMGQAIDTANTIEASHGYRDCEPFTEARRHLEAANRIIHEEIRRPQFDAAKRTAR